MNKVVLIHCFLVLSLAVTMAQQGASTWSVGLGGQVTYGFTSEADPRVVDAEGFLSGYSAAPGLGLAASGNYRVRRGFTLGAILGVDASRFSYDLISPPTFGEVNGRTVPGRNLTEFEGVGFTGFAELESQLGIGSSPWLPVLIFRLGFRSSIREHSNADNAYAAGYQDISGRDDAKHQLYYGAGFGVSLFSETNQLSLVYQRTLEPFEPLHNVLVLRQLFSLNSGNYKVTCPKF